MALHKSTHLFKSGWRKLGRTPHSTTKIRALGKNKGIMVLGLVNSQQCFFGNEAIVVS